jgi:PAS domain S-box-containing protein
MSDTRQYKTGIQYKFFKGIFIILFVGTCITSIVIGNSVSTMLTDSLMSKGTSLATNIAKRNENSLIISGEIRLNAVHSELITDQEIIYTVIRNNEGRILTTQYESINYMWPGLKAVLTGLSKDSDLPEMLAVIKKKADVREVSVPIMLGIDKLGEVTIGMSEHNIHKQIMITLFFLIALNFGVAFILGVVLFVTSKKMILNPVIELSRAADRIAKGDLSTQVSINASGEIRTLVDNFNQMAVNLDKTTVSKNYLDEIIGSMSDTLIVLAPDRTITRVNSAASVLLEYHDSDLVGRPIDLVLLDDEGGESDPLALVFEQGLKTVNSVEIVYRTRHGKKIPMLFSASAMRGIHGEIQGVVCVARDITDLKKAEEKLKKSSQEMKEMYEELRTFTYITSHDLRAPLVNIKGFTKELLRGIGEIGPAFTKSLEHVAEGQRRQLSQVIDKDIPEALKFIDSSANRMDMLINAIQKLSRFDRRKIVCVPIQTEDMVRKILNSMSHQIGSRGISVKVGELPELLSDRTAMEKIFGSLLDNAIKYLDPVRPGEIAITADLSDGQTIFHVYDNGRGIAAEDIPRAFESFRRVGKQNVPGEGMGLAYVKTCVRMLGGRVWCESTPGQGTTFSFSLPLRRDAETGEKQHTGGEATRRNYNV